MRTHDSWLTAVHDSFSMMIANASTSECVATAAGSWLSRLCGWVERIEPCVPCGWAESLWLNRFFCAICSVNLTVLLLLRNSFQPEWHNFQSAREFFKSWKVPWIFKIARKYLRVENREDPAQHTFPTLHHHPLPKTPAPANEGRKFSYVLFQ